MLKLGKLDLFVKLLELESFAANLKYDRGRATKYGVSSRAWPVDYERLESEGWNLDSVFLFYNREFMKRINSFSKVLEVQPGTASLLFFGRVHGVGINHYTRVFQEALNDLGFSLKVDGIWGPKTASTLVRAVKKGFNGVEIAVSRRDELVARRIRAVGAYPNGITNRVDHELAFARTTDRGTLFNL